MEPQFFPVPVMPSVMEECQLQRNESQAGKTQMSLFSQACPIFSPSSYSLAFSWQCAQMDTACRTSVEELTSQKGRRLCKGNSELSWHVAFIMDDVHQATNLSIPMRSDSVGKQEVGEKWIAFPQKSLVLWFHGTLQHLDTFYMYHYLRRWNSE